MQAQRSFVKSCLPDNRIVQAQGCATLLSRQVLWIGRPFRADRRVAVNPPWRLDCRIPAADTRLTCPVTFSPFRPLYCCQKMGINLVLLSLFAVKPVNGLTVSGRSPDRRESSLEAWLPHTCGRHPANRPRNVLPFQTIALLPKKKRLFRQQR